MWTNSAALWSDVIKTYPFPPWTIEVAYENRGDYYAKEHNELDKGLADYSTILLMRTTNYNIYKNIGNIYGLKGQESAKAGDLAKAKEFTDKAIDAFNTALSMNSNEASIYINLGITYSAMKRPDAAAVNFEKALKLQPGDMSLVERVGQACFYSGDMTGAVKAFTIQTQRDPRNANAWYNLSACYSQLGDRSNALANALKSQQLGYPVDQKYLDALRNESK